MSILTKVLLALVVLSIFPVVYFAAGVLSINQLWRQKYSELEGRLKAQEAKHVLLTEGDFAAQTSNYTPPLLPKGQLGVAQLAAARDQLKMGRGRMWYAGYPNSAADPAQQILTVQVVDTDNKDLPTHGIKDQAQLFLFSNPPATNKPDRSDFDKETYKYFGEFVVTNLIVGPEGLPASGKLTLKPAVPMTPDEWGQFRPNGGDLVMYDAMPSDQHDVFIGFDENDLRKFLPESSVIQYLADGKNIEDFPALKADPELSQSVEDAVDKKTGATIKVFRRPLRNYDQIFRDAALRLADINNELTIQSKEAEYSKRAADKAMEEMARLDQNKLKAQEELKVLENERMIAEAHLAKLNAKVAELAEELKTQLSTNKRIAEEIAGRKTASVTAPASAGVGIAATGILIGGPAASRVE